MADIAVDPVIVDTADTPIDPASIENTPVDPVSVDTEDIGRVGGIF